MATACVVLKQGIHGDKPRELNRFVVERVYLAAGSSAVFFRGVQNG